MSRIKIERRVWITRELAASIRSGTASPDAVLGGFPGGIECPACAWEITDAQMLESGQSPPGRCPKCGNFSIGPKSRGPAAAAHGALKLIAASIPRQPRQARFGHARQALSGLILAGEMIEFKSIPSMKNSAWEEGHEN